MPMRTRIGPEARLAARRRPPQCTRRRWERDEERIPLGIDLDTAVGAEGFADDAAMLAERLGVGSGAELMQKFGRALHVGEEEGDRSGGELASVE